MQLAELLQYIDSICISRNGEFDNLGLLDDNSPKLLAYICNQKYLIQAKQTPHITAVIVPPELVATVPPNWGIIVANDPRICFFEIHNTLCAQTEFYGPKIPSSIDPSATIHPTAYIAENNVIIGKDVIIGPRVCIMPNVTIEEGAVVRAGSVLGTEGFEFKRMEDGLLPVHHAGGVLIRAKAEIQANCCISKSVFRDPTTIGNSTKLDNLVHVAHNVHIGDRCMLAANACIAGSVRMGDDVWVGPSAVISNGIKIGNRAKLTLGSVVAKDVNDDETVSGNFAMPHSAFVKHWLNSRKYGKHS